MGMVLKPAEFSRAAKLGHFTAPTSQEILASESAPKKILSASSSEDVLSKLSFFFDKRSSFQPALLNRLSSARLKTASHIPAREDEVAKLMYSAYRRSLVDYEADDEGRYWSMKCAGTSDVYVTDASRAYIKHAFTAVDLRQKLLDRAVKTAGVSAPTDVFSEISPSMADDFGVDVLEKIAVQSIRQRAWLPPAYEQEKKR
jgi:hypothetical protein